MTNSQPLDDLAERFALIIEGLCQAISVGVDGPARHRCAKVRLSSFELEAVHDRDYPHCH
jgi:hypothetical protein